MRDSYIFYVLVNRCCFTSVGESASCSSCIHTGVKLLRCVCRRKRLYRDFFRSIQRDIFDIPITHHFALAKRASAFFVWQAAQVSTSKNTETSKGSSPALLFASLLSPAVHLQHRRVFESVIRMCVKTYAVTE